MAEYALNSSIVSNMTDRVDDVTIDTQDTDGANGMKQRWPNEDWTKWFGIYNDIPEVKIAFDMRAVWTIGNGFEADTRTTVILGNISGNGLDTFDSILKNLFVVKRINGDSFAEIIRKKNGELLNLKPLNPGRMVTIYSNKGRVEGYEYQIYKKREKAGFQTFKPHQILHLTNKRIADEMHGKSDINALQNIILANNESFDDMRKLMHRFVKPMFKFTYETEDMVEIEKNVAKMDSAVNKGENIHLPKGAMTQELISVPANATLNPMPWRDHLRNYFFQVVGIPQIILGSSGEFTESTAKIAYLAFEQSVKDEQKFIQNQLWRQVGIKVKFVFPASLKNELLSDEAKDGAQTTAAQPADLIAGRGA